MRTSLSILAFALFNPFFLQAQTGTATPDSVTYAPLIILVTDMGGQTIEGETILLRNAVTGQLFKGISDESGKFNLRVPAGFDYTITVKSILDSTKSGHVKIPAPGPGEYFSEPFVVSVKYESGTIYTLEDVHFDSGKATLRPDSYTELNELVTYLKNKPKIHIEIAGHTDNVGNENTNLKLSDERANTIRNYLLSHGILPGRVSAKGYGASDPVADNNTPEGRQLNRRTEVRIIN